MAEAVLFNIANEIFKKLESQALKIRWWWNLEDDLEKLKNISTIQVVLLDAEKQYSENRQVKFSSEDSMVGQRPDNLRVDALKNKLHAEINGKKYIIVLEEVWNEDAQNWLSLRDVLVANAKESKIIITTRSKIVAERARLSSIYELKGLSPAESWSLFKKLAFDQRQKPSLSQEASSFYCCNFSHMPLGIGEMTRLEKLYSFVAAKNGPSLEPVAGLGELNGLNNMRGELIIKIFRYVIKDGVSELRAANLEEKQYLQSLRLEWVIDPFSEPYSRAAFDPIVDNDDYYKNDEKILKMKIWHWMC
ncbi:hypothetical protein GH714_000744 [Hevea brasiliensis]|uniref:Uncharacterized protein n=1 Tax=Hevea brasiliensis TaxID=3981 RepID=A0A6A6KXG9_HEVBR|nr:hypothetical protein GH714_000744 [Hevea brasiliensis]